MNCLKSHDHSSCSSNEQQITKTKLSELNFNDKDIELQLQPYILLTNDNLETMQWSKIVSSPEAGAISSFIGTTRCSFKGKTVVSLSYEAYNKMALKQLTLIYDQIYQRWQDIHSVIIWHRLGEVPVGDASVIIAISSTHRASSLEAVAWAIDELKAIVPIWKKEKYTDGSEWKANCEFCPNKLALTTYNKECRN